MGQTAPPMSTPQLNLNKRMTIDMVSKVTPTTIGRLISQITAWEHQTPGDMIRNYPTIIFAHFTRAAMEELQVELRTITFSIPEYRARANELLKVTKYPADVLWRVMEQYSYQERTSLMDIIQERVNEWSLKVQTREQLPDAVNAWYRSAIEPLEANYQAAEFEVTLIIDLVVEKVFGVNSDSAVGKVLQDLHTTATRAGRPTDWIPDLKATGVLPVLLFINLLRDWVRGTNLGRHGMALLLEADKICLTQNRPAPTKGRATFRQSADIPQKSAPPGNSNQPVNTKTHSSKPSTSDTREFDPYDTINKPPRVWPRNEQDTLIWNVKCINCTGYGHISNWCPFKGNPNFDPKTACWPCLNARRKFDHDHKSCARWKAWSEARKKQREESKNADPQSLSATATPAPATRQYKPVAPKNDGDPSNKPSKSGVTNGGSNATTKPTTYTLHEGTVSQKP